MILFGGRLGQAEDNGLVIFEGPGMDTEKPIFLVSGPYKWSTFKG